MPCDFTYVWSLMKKNPHNNPDEIGRDIDAEERLMVTSEEMGWGQPG